MSGVDRAWGGDGAGRSREPSYSCSKPNGLLMKILVGLKGSLLSKGNWLPPKVEGEGAGQAKALRSCLTSVLSESISIFLA